MDMIVEPVPQSLDIKTPEVSGKKFWPRAGAYLIDTLFITGLNYLTTYLYSFIIGTVLVLVLPVLGKGFYIANTDTTCLRYLIGFIQTIVYFALFEWLCGRTLGKIVFNMYVISTDGSPCGFKQALTRSIYRLFDGLFFGIVANSYMKPPVYQRLGDQKANTFVVSSKDPFIKDKLPWWRFFLALVLYLIIELLIVSIGIIPLIQIK